jgi:hypothetical protein
LPGKKNEDSSFRLDEVSPSLPYGEVITKDQLAKTSEEARR